MKWIELADGDAVGVFVLMFGVWAALDIFVRTMDNEAGHRNTDIHQWEMYRTTLVWAPVCILAVIWCVVALTTGMIDYLYDADLSGTNKTLWVYGIYVIMVSITYVYQSSQEGDVDSGATLELLFGLGIWIVLSFLYKLFSSDYS